jgi:hypothetical protein
MKAIRHKNRDFTIQGIASAYEHGYEVAFKGKDDGKRWVQFRVLLNSAMDLVAVVDRISERVSTSDIVATREIAVAELAENPSVFHVVKNAFYEMSRLRRAVDEATGLRKVKESDPHVVATEARIVELDTIVKDAREWAREPTRCSFEQFLNERRIGSNSRGFDTSDKLEVGDEFHIHRPLGPIELFCGAMRLEPKPNSVVIIEDFADLTSVRDAVGERREFDWPRLGNKVESDLSITSVRAYDMVPNIADHVVTKLADEAVVIGWTRQTETAAFEKILDRLEATGLDPKVIIGSPEGTFTGRASAIRMAILNAPALSPAVISPAPR